MEDLHNERLLNVCTLISTLFVVPFALARAGDLLARSLPKNQKLIFEYFSEDLTI